MKLRVLIAAMGLLMVLAGVGWLSMQDSVNIRAHAHDATSSALEPRSDSITTNDESPKPDGVEVPSENDLDAAAESPDGALPTSGITGSTPGEEIDPNTEPGRYILEMLAVARAGDLEVQKHLRRALNRCDKFSYHLQSEAPPPSTTLELQALWLEAQARVSDMCGTYFASDLMTDYEINMEVAKWRFSHPAHHSNEEFVRMMRGIYEELPVHIQAENATRMRALLTEAIRGANTDLMQEYPLALLWLVQDGIVEWQTPDHWDFSDIALRRAMGHSMQVAICDVYNQCDSISPDDMLNDCLRDWYTCLPADTTLVDYALEALVLPRDSQAFLETYTWLVKVFENRDLAALGLSGPDDP